MPDKPWMMRTYSGHSTARASNELYRTNLAKAKPGSPLPSTFRHKPVSTLMPNSQEVKLEKLGSPWPTLATCERCSTAFRLAR